MVCSTASDLNVGPAHTNSKFGHLIYYSWLPCQEAEEGIFSDTKILRQAISSFVAAICLMLRELSTAVQSKHCAPHQSEQCFCVMTLHS